MRKLIKTLWSWMHEKLPQLRAWLCRKLFKVRGWFFSLKHVGRGQAKLILDFLKGVAIGSCVALFVEEQAKLLYGVILFWAVFLAFCLNYCIISSELKEDQK